MKTMLLSEAGGQRTFAVVFDTGDEVPDGLLAFADEHGVSGASFTAIGAFQRATLGYFDIERRDYARIIIDEQVEVLTLSGNIALAGDERKVHAHVVVGKADGTAHGGHLLHATVRPTLEVVVIESPAALCRTVDAATGLPLLNLNQSTR
jgi:predicted DNA-binding protein with PD1-like motif